MRIKILKFQQMRVKNFKISTNFHPMSEEFLKIKPIRVKELTILTNENQEF